MGLSPCLLILHLSLVISKYINDTYQSMKCSYSISCSTWLMNLYDSKNQCLHHGNNVKVKTSSGNFDRIRKDRLNHYNHTWRRVRATSVSITGPRSSFSRWTSSIISSFTKVANAISLLLRVITSHFSGVVTIICQMAPKISLDTSSGLVFFNIILIFLVF